MSIEGDEQDWNGDGIVGPVEGFIGDRRRFARDVLVNVLANLLAAAILYVLGVLVGLFPRSGPALFIAFLLMGSLTLGGAEHLVRTRRIRRTPSWLEDAAALYIIAFYGVALLSFPHMPWFLRWFCYFGIFSGLVYTCNSFYGRIKRRSGAHRHQ